MNTIKYKELLSKYISFKSISTDTAFLGEIKATVGWLRDSFEKNGFDVQIIQGKKSNPVVFANYSKIKGAKTVLVYGHYDVQPAEKSDGWSSEPFTLTEKDGKLVARGVVDNKGQALIHAYTVFELIKINNLKYNVKFLIEGNEETSNDELGLLIKENKSKLKCDCVLISDGEIPYKPTVEYSLRGGFNVTLKYVTAKNNLHSGIFGGAIPSASYELSKFLAKLYDKNNKVNILGFYAGVDKITAEQVKSNKKLLKVGEDVLKMTGAKKLVSEPGLDFFTQTGLRPTVQITGIKSGYIGEGYANIVPSSAEARINFRLVTSQDPETIYKAFEKFVKSETPKYVSYELSRRGVHKPVRIDITSKTFTDVKRTLKEAFGEEALIKPVGGAIPVVSDFKETLGVDTLLISLGNEDCNMHGVNENFDIGLLEKGLKFSELFFSR